MVDGVGVRLVLVPLNPLNIWLNWNKFCLILLQEESTPPLAHLPLSRPTDQKASRPIWLSLAQSTKFCASSKVNVLPISMRSLIKKS